VRRLFCTFCVATSRSRLESPATRSVVALVEQEVRRALPGSGKRDAGPWRRPPSDRRELQRMLKAIRPGDVVTVTRIDRLARSTFDLFAIVKAITDAGGQFRSLAEPWADTATGTGRLMIAFLGGLADVERDLIRTRTAEGRSRAKGRGQHMDRPPALTPQQQAEARQRRGDGATLKELAQSYNVGISTIARSLSDLSLSRNYLKVIPIWAQFHYFSWRTQDIIFQKIPIFA